MFGLTFEKLLIIGIIAAFLLGPDRLPHYASLLAKFVKNMRTMANDAKDRMRDEMGEDFNDVDWKKLDPRQYDPRRIIREALLDDDDDEEPVQLVRPAGSAAADDVADGEKANADAASNVGALPPFDSEAT